MNDTRWGVARSALVIFAFGLTACGSGDSSGPPAAGPPAALTVVSGNAQDVPAGEAAPVPLAVKVVDKDGKAVAKALVTFTITAGGGTLSAALDTTDTEGLASVSWTVGSNLGDGRVEARVQGVLVPVAFTATIKAGLAAAIQQTSDAVGNAAAGFAIGDSVAIRIADRFGHPLSGATVTFAVTAGGGSVSSATRTTGADGVARTAWTMGVAGAQSLRATSGALEVTVTGNAVTCPESQLAVGAAVTIEPGSPQCVVLTAAGQRYVVTVVNPTNSPSAFDLFKFRGASGVGAATSTTSAPVLSAQSAMSSESLPAAVVTELRQAQAAERIHAKLLRSNMEMIERFGPLMRKQAQARANSNIVMTPPLPNVGDVIDMKIPKNFNNLCDASISTSPDAGTARVRGRVVYVGPHSVMVDDSTNLLAGELDALYRSVGEEFDNVMWPILTTNFGNPLAMDAQLQNTGRVFMVFSKVVNALQSGNLAGFVSSGDFVSPAVCASSNQEAVFYARVPTKAGGGFDQENNTQTSDEWLRGIRTIIIHEVKHVTSFAEKMSRGGTPQGFFSKDQWLEEGSAMMAEELWARGVFGYAQRGNVNYASSIYCEVRPTPNVNWPQCQPTKPISLIDHYFYLYDYEITTETKSMVGPVASGDFTFYGIGWMFLRWAIDQYSVSESDFLKTMTRELALPGIQNIEARTGKSFPQLLSEFSIALTLDDYPNFTPLNPKHTISSWNTRNIFSGLSADFSSQNFFTRPVPMKIRTGNFGNFAMGELSVAGGSMSVMEISGTQTNKQLFEFKGSTGQEFPASMRINVVRVQ